MEGSLPKDRAAVDAQSYLREKSALVNSFLAEYMGSLESLAPRPLLDSMKYSLLSGGKRLRPALAIASYEACGGRGEDIAGCAAAIEAIHTYSLIHDDLPAMDDDDLRRGEPTNHKVFGEAMAILAGDGLLTEALLMLLRAEGRIARDRLLEAVRELSFAAGPRGMVGGQAQDILSENAKPEADTLSYIHRHKTGALIRASVRLGGILAGAREAVMDALTGYGENLGLAFQIVDDVLDVTGQEEVIGKPVGSDQMRNKMTYPALYGLDGSMRIAEDRVARALTALEGQSRDADPLRAIAEYIIRRNR